MIQQSSFDLPTAIHTNEKPTRKTSQTDWRGCVGFNGESRTRVQKMKSFYDGQGDASQEAWNHMLDVDISGGKLLIVDDEEENVFLLERVLRHAGYAYLRSTTDPRQVLSMFLEYQPDLILLDLQMPHLDGHAVMKQLAARIRPGTYLPILVLTADLSPEAKQRALSLNAKDFLNKPFDITEMLLRIRNLLETRFLYLQVQSQNQFLEAKVVERTRELEEAQIEILERLARAAEFRDDNTGQHTRRMGETSALIARALGKPGAWIEILCRAAPLHDLGKIGIRDRILLKPGRLTTEEFDVMKTHTVIGASVLTGSRSSPLQMAEVIALTHHERWDGTGYARLKGEAIPIEGRIVAVADVFDALTHARPYKPAWSTEEAVVEIKSQSGRQFDPQVVEAFLKVLPEVLAISQAMDGCQVLQFKEMVAV
jgi:putative two-component system response regulator